MQAEKLYQKLDSDFIKTEFTDEWFKYMSELKNYLAPNFQQQEMGLVFDFTPTINKVYTAVFPSDKVLKKILEDDISEALLFVHHPMVWDIGEVDSPFKNIPINLLEQLKEQKIAIYSLHVPLDAYGEFSTSKTLATSLGLKIIKPFAFYRGGLAGVITKNDRVDNLENLMKLIEGAVGHKCKGYFYGKKICLGDKIAIVAGGGNDLGILKEMKNENVQTLITGVTVENDFSKNAHEFAKNNKINIIGATHYSTEKFACLAMVDYFKKLNLPAEFIEDEPMMEDL